MYQSNQSKCKPYPCAALKKEAAPRKFFHSPPPKPYVRQLAISYLFHSGRVPLIRLCGKWLKDAGFAVNDKVKVTVKDNLLILEPMK